MKQYKDLTQKEVKRLLAYKDGRLVWRPRPLSDFKNKLGYAIYHAVNCGMVAGSADIRGYCSVGMQKDGVVMKYLVHRLVWFWHYGTLPEQLDHINGNKMDNRIENLRPANEHQNKRNRKKTISNTSGYKGVSFETKRNQWRAGIRAGSSNITIGRYTTRIEAALAYDNYARKIHGEYARLNFPESHEQGA